MEAEDFEGVVPLPATGEELKTPDYTYAGAGLRLDSSGRWLYVAWNGLHESSGALA